MTASTDRIAALYDLMVDNPEGLDVYAIAAEMDCDVQLVREAIRGLRLLLAEQDDTITLICAPNGQCLPWLYTLTGTMSEAMGWERNRLRDAESRIETMTAVLSPFAHHLDARTTEGKKARVMHRGLTRLQEDLADLKS